MELQAPDWESLASEAYDAAKAQADARAAANVERASRRILENAGAKEYIRVPGWTKMIPGADWVDAGIIAIVDRDDRKNPEHQYYKSYSAFAKMLGVDRATICRHCNKLEANGILVKLKRRGARGASVWHINSTVVVRLLGWQDRSA